MNSLKTFYKQSFLIGLICRKINDLQKISQQQSNFFF